MFGFLQGVASTGDASFEIVHTGAFQKSSLPGFSRYLAACQDRFRNNTIILTDADPLPMDSAGSYISATVKELEESTGNNTVAVDFVYSQTQKFSSKNYKFVQNTSVLEKNFYRQPRFRTCYLLGKGLAFRRIMFNNGVLGDGSKIPVGAEVSSLWQRFYTEDVICLAYSPP